MLTGWWSLKILLDCTNIAYEVGIILIPYFSKLFIWYGGKSIDYTVSIVSIFLYFFYKSWQSF
jgi:hypothetical protein